MKDTLQKLLVELVEHPDDVNVEEESTPETVILKVRIHSQDMGRIIGKGGKTISSIRTLMRIAARNSSQRIQVELLEPVNDPDEDESDVPPAEEV